MESNWSSSIVLVETHEGKVRVTVSNAEDTEMKILFKLPSDVAINFAEAILLHAVHIEEQINDAVERLTTLE